MLPNFYIFFKENLTGELQWKLPCAQTVICWHERWLCTAIYSAGSNTENVKSRQVSVFLLVARGPGSFLTLPASKDAVSPSNLILSYPILNWQGQRFYFNWSLTLKTKSCFKLFYNIWNPLKVLRFPRIKGMFIADVWFHLCDIWIGSHLVSDPPDHGEDLGDPQHHQEQEDQDNHGQDEVCCQYHLGSCHYHSLGSFVWLEQVCLWGEHHKD